jgi:hypothetical protein
MRQGFIEPTPEGKPLLEDATGVWRAMAAHQRAKRSRDGEETAEDLELVTTAQNRREELNLELRDEEGVVFECDFMRVYDLFDMNSGVIDDMGETEEEEQADFEVYLSGLSSEQRADELARRAATDAELEEILAEFQQQRDEEALLGSSWPPPPDEDPRWNTMQYHLQVFLKTCFDDGTGFPYQGFTGSSE